MNFCFNTPSYWIHHSDLYDSPKCCWFGIDCSFKCVQLICIERAPLGGCRKYGWAKEGSCCNGGVKLVRCRHGMGHINSIFTQSPPPNTTHHPTDSVMWGKQMRLTKGSSFHPIDVCWKSNDCRGEHVLLHVWVRLNLSNFRLLLKTFDVLLQAQLFSLLSIHWGAGRQ